MQTLPQVSVLIIFYNAGPYFREAIDSVFSQTFPHWELLLADDGSTDGSSDVARAYVQQHPARVRYLQHPGGVNRGMSATRNLGLAHASAPLLALLDSDDRWVPTKLEEQVALMAEHPTVALLFGRGLIWHSWSGREQDRNRDWVNLGDIPANRCITTPEFLVRWLQNDACQPCTSEILARTACLREAGGWDASFRGLYEDNVLYTKLFTRYPIYFSERTWCHYRQHESNCCHTAMRQGEWAPGRPSVAKERILLWVERYLADNPQQDPALTRALTKALEPYRHPVRFQVRHFPGRVARRLTQAIKR